MKNNFLRHLKNFTYLTIIFLSFPVFFTAKLNAQEVVDKTIVTVSDGVRTELIT